ncbi:branched-chain amino acid ABC transporter permease [Pseudothauera rhizosphaerae]|uniref:Branched-chain amino acid ABC transporter permease n=1 Tax=Pseudothauera rhizosphaerae TaxID=2565932 RepID=A0A4S4AZB8_9RHOO|nr:branched-chain amino acid ABC transporter permease [Pseudothauera rhizosphaerae]THF65373.1 branched-chain amino acid ABC transporter permease [Pseudothauera rhizosphaerae]
MASVRLPRLPAIPRRAAAAALLAAAAGIVALMGAGYALGQLALVATFAIAGLGVVLIVGQAGQITLGQGALLALGAYTEGLLARHGLPPPVSLPAAVAVAAGGGWLASLPARRLGGLYFAMSTLAFALIVEELLARAAWLTGGAAGLTVPTLALGPVAAGGAPAEAAVSVAALALAWAACRRWVDSRLGRAWHAIRADEGAAAASGIDCARAKAAAFAIGGGLSGLAGALYAHWIGFVSPEQFGLMLSFELLVLAFIGGARHLAGALWGALIIVAIPQLIALLRDLLPSHLAATAGLELLLFGAVLVAVVLWRPQGIAGR